MQKRIITFRNTAIINAVSIVLFTCFVQVHSSQAQDCDNYRFSTTSAIPYISLPPSPISTLLFSGGMDDAVSSPQNIGFSFNYCGSMYNQFIASSNGFIYLGNASSGPAPSNSLATITLPVLAPFWDDLAVSSTGLVSYHLDISGGLGWYKLEIEYQKMKWSHITNNLVSFKIRLDEHSGIIEYQYSLMNNSSGVLAGASIGIANKTAGINHFISITETQNPDLPTFSNWVVNDSNTFFTNTTVNNITYEFIPYYSQGICEGPHTLSITNIANNTATINWIPPILPSSFFDIFYSVLPTDPNVITPLHQVTGCVGNGNPVFYDSVQGTSSSYTLTGLLSDTTYYVWVRSDCASCSYSNWMPCNTSGAGSFHTSVFSHGISRISAASGSYAPWGFNQFLVIDSLGNTAIYSVNLENDGTDSVFLSLSQSQLQSIMDTVYTAGFYSLNNLYNGGFEDGSGIYLDIASATDRKVVEVINYCNDAINRIVRTINAAIISSGIQLRYGELDQVCP